jgi:hypothetical protein
VESAKYSILLCSTHKMLLFAICLTYTNYCFYTPFALITHLHIAVNTYMCIYRIFILMMLLLFSVGRGVQIASVCIGRLLFIVYCLLLFNNYFCLLYCIVLYCMIVYALTIYLSSSSDNSLSNVLFV